MDILKGIWQMSFKDDTLEIARKFSNGQRIINNNEFRSLVRSYNNKISDQQIDQFFKEICAEYSQPVINTYIIHQMIRKYSQTQQQTRQANEIINVLNAALARKNLDLSKVLNIFDLDKKGFLKEEEFAQFIEYYIPNLARDEFKITRATFKAKIINTNEVRTWLNEGKPYEQPSNAQYQPQPASEQAKKMQNLFPQPQKKEDQPQQPSQIKPTQKNEQPTPQKVEANVAKPDTTSPKVNPFAKAVNTVKAQNADAAASVHPNFNKTLAVIQSAIDFKEIVKLDHPLPGLDDFLKNFHDLDLAKQQYTDNKFPATQNSLGMKAGNFAWKRLADIWGDKHQIFEKDSKHPSVGLGEWIDAEDILQGALGDCYFLSSLSVIAMKWPLVIFNAFLTQKANHVGMYAVKYFVDGVETCIVIDDFIPVNGDKPAFTQSTGDESWVMLLEKAWAKVFDSYSNIIAGRSIEVLKCFLGGPTWTIKTDDKDFRTKLQDAVDKDCAMTVGTFAENSGKNFKEMGLVPGHAYACLGVRYIQHPQKGKVELIKLRNPWGKTEWKGDWSDQSPLWTPELRDEGQEDDGIFHMQYEHFIMYYQSVDCAYYKENYKYQAIPFKTKKNKALYASFELPEDGEYYISIHQKSERHYRSKYQNYKYSQMRLVLGLDAGQGQFKFVDAKGAVYQDDFVGGKLKKGKYVLSAKINWAYAQEDDMAVSIYGPNKIELNIIQKSQVPQFHEQVMLDRARQNTETTSFKESDQIKKCNEIKMEWGLGYFYYSNKSNKTLEMDISFTQMQGLKLKKPNRMNKYKVQVSPGKEQIVLVTVASDGFGMGQSMSYSVR